MAYNNYIKRLKANRGKKSNPAGGKTNEFIRPKGNMAVKMAEEITAPYVQGYLNERAKLSRFERLTDAFGEEYAMKKLKKPDSRNMTEKDRKKRNTI